MSAVVQLHEDQSSRLKGVLDLQKRAFQEQVNPDYETRVDRLNRLLEITVRHQVSIADAISADFGWRSRHETLLAEIFLVQASITHARRNLRKWMKPRAVRTALHFRPGAGRIIRQPLGVTGIIGPWNYPYQLTMLPAVAALAAGNRVMIKPSEHAPRTGNLLRAIIGDCFREDEFAVITGDATIAKAFAELPFDHLFFTGSTSVGREVAVAAARNLTPVTLELGGKSPVIIDADCDLRTAARRIAFGKLLNAGQTCIAPDYALVPRQTVVAFVRAIESAATELYPSLGDNPDYTWIASGRHYRRLLDLICDARQKGAWSVEINPCAEVFPDGQRTLPLTILIDVTDDMTVMKEEIFGPILPVIPYDTINEAIGFVNRRPRPLALYWFGKSRRHWDMVLRETISGGATINDTLWHVCQDHLPFGGVGESGVGAYHGERGFLAFTKEKAVFFQRPLTGVRLLYPPYGKMFDWTVRLLRRIV